MPSGPSDFTLSNLKRSITGATMAGVDIGRIEIDPKSGVISIIPQRPEAKPAKTEIAPPDKKLREWD